MRTQITAVVVFMLLFAGSSSLLTRALAQPKPLTALQQEKRVGPKPTPHWYWSWVEWRLGEGQLKGHRIQPSWRPSKAPRLVPAWAWRRLHFYLRARNGRNLAAQPRTKRQTSATTSGAVGLPGGGKTYDQAISYTQTRPSFNPTRTILVSTAAQLQSAISKLQPGDLVQAKGSFTVAGETVIKNRLSSPAELDLTGVRFVNSSGKNAPAVWLNNAQNLYIFGGDASTADTGGQGIYVYGSQNVVWWGFTIHDTGSTGFAARAIGGPVNHDDFQGTIWKVGQNLAWDTHAEKGTGLHAANLWDGATAGNFTNNRFAFYAHDIPTGACVEFGNDDPTSQATGNVLYLKCVNETDVARKQTGGNALQCWGDTNTLGLDVKYIEGDNLQGYAFWGGGVSKGQNLHGVTIEYGRASRTNLNPRYAGQSPWMTGKSVAYNLVAPALTH